VTGTAAASAKAPSRVVAASALIISPAISRGRSARSIIAAAWRSWDSEASAASMGRGAGTATSPASPSVTSSGSTTITGPGRPAMAIANASAVMRATSAGSMGCSTAFAMVPKKAA